MSGTGPEIPEELHILAGEYVLGALDAAEMRAVRGRARTDAALAAAIAAWERRLAPLAGVVAPQAPPPALWDRLERAIAEVPPEDIAEPRPRPVPVLPRPTAEVLPLVPRQPPPRRKLWPWQLTTAAALALAAGIAVVAFVPQVALRLNLAPEAPRIAALLPTDGKITGGFIAQIRADGSVVLAALPAVAVPSGRDLELWVLRPGEKVPASLGVLPAGGKRVVLPGLPADGTKLLVSVEQPGGSPSGLPTGPVVYAGAVGQLSL